MLFNNIFSEPQNIHFLDVKETYFNGYRSALDSFYKNSDPERRIYDYKKIRIRGVYRPPYYTDADIPKVNQVSRKFFFATNAHYNSCNNKLAKLNRTMTTVGSLLFITKKYNNNCVNRRNCVKYCNKCVNIKLCKDKIIKIV